MTRPSLVARSGRGGRVAAALVAASGLVLGACSAIVAPASYRVSADFSRTVGLYPGSFVRQLGIDIGSVTKVVNQTDHVRVTMSIQNKYPLRPDAQAILVGDSILGERYVQFTPAWTGGDRMANGALVPIERTAVPVETDQVLRSLRNVLGAIDPKNASDLINNLATLIDGQGPKINTLLTNAAGTLSLLADKSVDLGQLTDSLSSLTGALRTRTDALASLIRDYDTVSGIIAGDRQSVDGTITALSSASGQAAGLLATNLPGIEDDIRVLTTAGQTIDRNLSAVDLTLSSTPKLFQAAKNAYDPQHDWLPLNTQSSPGTSSAVLAARVRDSLAGLCRRLAKKNPAMAAPLAACGDPNSGFFDPILNTIPTVIGQLPGQTGPATGAAATQVRAAAITAGPVTAGGVFADGLGSIPGLSAAQQSALALVSSAVPGLATPTAPDPAAMLDPGQMLAARPAVVDAPAPHPSLIHRVTSWVGRLFGSL